jgi:hypothetical protein
MTTQSRHALDGREEKWITWHRAAKRLNIVPCSVGRLIDGGHLTTRPGSPSEILAADVEYIAAVAARPARTS